MDLESRVRRYLNDLIKNAFGVWSAIDMVAQKDDDLASGVIHRQVVIYSLDQRRREVRTTMDIANRPDHTAGRRLGWWRDRPFKKSGEHEPVIADCRGDFKAGDCLGDATYALPGPGP